MGLLSGIVNSGAIPVMETMLRFNEARQRVIANNIANVDTPHYRARDLDVKAFEKTLSRAIARRRPGEPFGLASSGNIRSEGGRTIYAAIERPGTDPLRHDMNNVSRETEMGIAYKNAMTARVMTRLLRMKYGMLKSAASLRVR